eukprot:1981956-Lingulodinium_polyedra.AAC.1
MAEAKRSAGDLARAKTKKFAANVAGPKGDAAAYALRKPGPGPASVVWVDGRPVVDPSRIDRCFREAWRA